MSRTFDRRAWLKMVGAAAMLPACDTVDVQVESKDGAANADGLLPLTPNEYFYVYQQGEPPDTASYDPNNWTMEIRIGGQVVGTLDAAYFADHEPIEIEHTLQCIGGNPRNTLINNAVWGGLPFEAILSELGYNIPPETVELRMQGADLAGASGLYSTAVPIADVVEGRVWLVWQLNQGPLPFEHGAPCRFIVQGRYGTKNVKWPTYVDLSSEPYLGYWERLNWSNAATYRVNGFILNPADGTTVGPGIVIFGTAYAGLDPIDRVEISFDDGAAWQDAEIYYSPGPNRWTLWNHLYRGEPGAVHARIRVTTVGGEVTTGIEGSNQAEGYDGGMEIRFEVQG